MKKPVPWMGRDNMKKSENKAQLDPWTREELRELRERAKKSSEDKCLNLSWRRAYERLEDALDCLDGKIARTEIHR